MREPGDWGDGPVESEEGLQPTVGDRGTCGECGDDVTLTDVGPGPTIEGVVIGRAVEWLHDESVKRMELGYPPIHTHRARL